MSMQPADDPVITYTVRDLLVRIETKLDNKADKADLATLQAQVDEQKADTEALKMWRAKLIGWCIGAGAGGGAGLGALINAFGN